MPSSSAQPSHQTHPLPYTPPPKKQLAVGYTLDQIPNDITQKTPASFEPSIDYIITKIPKFAFEKFPGTKAELTTQMKSVGEVMAIGRTWQESLQKALRGMEAGLDGWSLPK
jgi:carbamoyl-phosphate synthase large subunit